MNKISRRFFLKTSIGTGVVLTVGSKNAAKLLAADNLRVGILYDTEKCINCQQCVKACNEEYNLQPEEAYLGVKEFREDGKYFRKRSSCMHCEDAACVTACPTKALYKGNNGLTYVDSSKCIGCQYCKRVCPYEAIKMKNGRVSKCVGCQSFVEEGNVPRCVKVCPAEALSFGQWEELGEVGLETVNSSQGKFPEAQVYGGDKFGGLGLLIIIYKTPEIYGYPADSEISAILSGWKELLHTGGLGVTAAVAGLGIMTFGIARNNYNKEKLEEEKNENE
ncbi:MAG: hypothetical protein APF76_00410 [Desulfitibacter sp. BRH_c19]|nr:MAG: hypothetical protein APF76_00410 [Desulfitibacter sp. BRH_c19]